MRFEENKLFEKIGLLLGSLVAYFIFSFILFYILFFLNKLPEQWSYLHVFGLTLFITFLGFLLRRLLR